jgi:hypothetical protein
MAVVLAALSLPPISALAWWTCARTAAVPPSHVLTRSFAAETAVAAEEALRAEPEPPEGANLLLSFGVRRADNPAAETTQPATESAGFSPGHPETINATLCAIGGSHRIALRRNAQTRADAGPPARRASVRSTGASARRQERRRCVSPRREAPAAKIGPEEQYLGDATGGEPPASAPNSCQAGDLSSRSRTRL